MKKKFLLGIYIFFIAIVVINALFFLARFIILENEAEKYLQEEQKSFLEKEVEVLVTQNTEPLLPSEDQKIKKIAIVIDDLGVRTIRYYLLDAINEKLNLAVIPGETHSLDIIKAYNLKPNFELLMHMPMEPFETKEDRESPYSKTTGYKYIITSEDNKKTIHSKLDEAFGSLLGLGLISGVNNHMGSYVTSSRDMVNEVVIWAKKNNLYVLDSLTAPSSVFYEQARKLKVKAAYNQIFLDSSDEPEHIKKQLERVKKVADKEGQVIAIGHIGKQYTMEILFDWMPSAVIDGYTFVFVSELVQ